MRDFKPKPGQTDYTNAKEAPVLNCVVKFEDKILIVKRSGELGFYPGLWHGIAGFLDDGKGPLEKAKEELMEETGIGPEHVFYATGGPVFRVEDAAYEKTWHIHTVLLEVDTDKVELNWEATDHRWVALSELCGYELLPGFERVAKLMYKEAAKV